MSETAGLLELSAKRSRLHALAGERVLDRRQLGAALAAADLRPTRASWAAYLYWHALIIGVVLVVAGVIFFVAANWSALSGGVRMGLVAGAMVAATLTGGYLGDSLAGRAASLLGGLLFGPLLAVYGQVYQTGADAWELFATWALVVLAYAGVVRFVGTWVVALALVHVAWFTWIDQELGGALFEGRNAWLVACVAIVDAAVVAAAERWLHAREQEVVAAVAAWLGLAVVLPFGIVTLADELPPGGGFGLVVLIAGLAAIWLVYRWRRPRLAMLVALATVVTILTTVLLGRVLFEGLEAELFGVALLGASLCGQVWALTRWLLRWRREQPPQAAPVARERRPSPGPRPRRPSLAVVLEAIGVRRSAGDPRLRAALHDGDGSDGALIVRVFTAIGTWIGAAMTAVLFIAMELYELPALAGVLGLGLFAGATLLSRRPGRSLAMTQVIWAMTLGAHGLWLGALAHDNAVDETTVAAAWTLLNLLLLLLIRVPSLQLASAVCAVGFATWFVANLELMVFPIWVAVPAACVATAAWVFEDAWAARLGRTWSAIAYGLPLGLAGPAMLLSLDDRGAGLVAGGWGAPAATAAMIGLIAAVLGWAGHELRASRHEQIARPTHLIGVLVLVAAVTARQVPGLSLALLWLLVAHLRRSPSLQVVALVQLAGFLLFFYYQLETSLLLKSVWVLSTGLVLLLGAWLGRPRTSSRDGHPEPAARRPRWLPALGLSLLTTGLVVGGSIDKQRILATGETVLLPLAPVDPRSLMQGDYMVLRYALEQELGLDPFMALPDSGSGSVDAALAPAIARHGRLVVRVDEDRVGRFARIDDGRPLAPDELRIEYRLRDGWDGRVRIGAESFLFEEGQADAYAGARYGELVVDGDGSVVLVGLRDAERRPLGPRLHAD